MKSQIKNILFVCALFPSFAARSQARLEIKSETLDLGEFPVGVTTDLEIGFRNIGNGILAAKSCSSGHESVTCDLLNSVAYVGGYVTIQVKITPTKRGMLNSSLLIKSDAVNSIIRLNILAAFVGSDELKSVLAPTRFGTQSECTEFIYPDKSNIPTRIVINSITTSSCGFQKLLMNVLRTDLLESYIILERESLELLTEEMRLGMTGIQDASSVVEYGNHLGAQAFLLVNTDCENEPRSGTVRLIDGESSQVIWSCFFDGCSPAYVSKAITNSLAALSAE